jgi:hypothetical protein
MTDQTTAPTGVVSSTELGVIARTRYTVVRTSFWWRVKVGSGSQTVGRCYTQLEAERLASGLKTAFLDGAFVAEERDKALRELGQLMQEQYKNRSSPAIYG